MTRHNAPRIAFVLFAVVILIYGALVSLAYGFAASGGTVAVNSHTVEIDARTDGDIITVTGNRNTVQQQRPYEPENEQHQRGEWVFLAIVVAAGFGAIVYWWHRVGGNLEFVMVSQKEPK